MPGLIFERIFAASKSNWANPGFSRQALPVAQQPEREGLKNNFAFRPLGSWEWQTCRAAAAAAKANLLLD
jgi:hypothetical protein